MRKYICIILLFFPSSINADEISIDSSKVHILDYPNSFDNLIHRFKGKVIYIDLMASWCKPCIEELKESKKMDSYLEENNVIKIYVTIDQKQDIDKCISLLNKHNAKGYFVPYLPPQGVTTTFASDIEKLFLQTQDGGMDISIPKYAIVDKEGNIVVQRAERPSNKDALIKQLKEWIDK